MTEASPLFELVRNLGPTRLFALGGVGFGVIAFFAFLLTRLSTPNLALLYSELSADDSAQIASRLETMSIPYEVRANGSQVHVPSDKVLRLRVNMAEEGLPSGGNIGYELFDRSDGLGASNFVQEVNRLRALEGELARTIKEIDPIKSARVHLVLPRRELFSRDRQQATASVVVKLPGNRKIKKAQVLSIQHLVAAAVPGLMPDRVSVIDSKGNLLARGTSRDDDSSAAISNAEDMRRDYEDRLRHDIEELLERSVGLGKVRATVTADMDFDRITTNSETFDPEGQVVRSTQSIEEDSDSSDSEGGDPVTVAEALPDLGEDTGGAGQQSSSSTARIEEVVNYEISKTVRTHLKEGGVVRRLSIAVLVDGTYSTDEEGESQYQPRPEEEMERLTALVRSAVGFNEERGDTLEIANMEFVRVDTRDLGEPEGLFLGLERHDLFRAVEIIVIGFVAVLVVLLVIRPMIKRVLEAIPSASAAAAAAVEGLAGDGNAIGDRSKGGPQAIAGPGGGAAADALIGEDGGGAMGGAGGLPSAGGDPAAGGEDSDSMIDLARIDGKVKASSVNKISELIDRHPDEAVSILRSWMIEQG